MSEVINPPEYYFTGINFNPAFYAEDAGGLSVAQANALYLRKTVPDTVTAQETFNAGIKLGYAYNLYSGNDTILGGYKETFYQYTGSSLSLNNTQMRVLGSFPSIVSAGVYQLNSNTTMGINYTNPRLIYSIYTDTSNPWIDGELVSGLRIITQILSLKRTNRYSTLLSLEAFSPSMSGLLVLPTAAYVAILITHAQTGTTANIGLIDTYMNIVRVS